MSESILVYNLNCKAYLLQNIELINMSLYAGQIQ